MFMNTVRAVTTLASLLSAAACFAAEVDKGSLHIPQRLGNVTLHHSKEGFTVREQGIDVPVKPYMVDKELRGISSKDLSKILVNGGYIAVNNRSGSDYSLQLNGRIKGGGPLGATVGAVVTKCAVHIAAQGVFMGIGAIVGVITCNPAVGVATYTGISNALTPAVEVMSISFAVAGGIAGGVITGPA